MFTIRAVTFLVVPIFFGVVFPSNVHAAISLKADLMCHPVFKECPCGYVKNPGTGICEKTDEEDNMHQCRCFDTQAGEQIEGHCVAVNHCYGDYIIGKDGKKRPIEPDKPAPVSIEPVTLWEPPSAQETPLIPDPSLFRYIPAPNAPGEGTNPWDGVGTEPTPVSELERLVRDAQANQPVVEIQAEAQPKSFLQSTLERWGVLTPGTALTPGSERQLQFEGGSEPVTLHGTLMTEVPAQTTGFSENSPAPFREDVAFAPEPSACSDIISCAQRALGFTPAQEDPNKDMGVVKATIYYPGCVGAPAGCNIKVEGGMVGDRDNLIDPKRTVAAGPQSGLDHGDVVKLTNPMTKTTEYAVVGDKCPSCGSGIDLTSGLAKSLGVTETKGFEYIGVQRVSEGSSYTAGLKMAANLNGSDTSGIVFAANSNAPGLSKIAIASSGGYAPPLYDQVATAPAPVPDQVATPNPSAGAQNYTGSSVVDYLRASGQSSDLNSRAQLAAQYGLVNSVQAYMNLAKSGANGSVNTQLLQQLRGR